MVKIMAIDYVYKNRKYPDAFQAIKDFLFDKDKNINDSVRFRQDGEEVNIMGVNNDQKVWTNNEFLKTADEYTAHEVRHAFHEVAESIKNFMRRNNVSFDKVNKNEVLPYYAVTVEVDGLPVQMKFDNNTDALDHFMANKNSKMSYHNKYDSAGFEIAGYNNGVSWYTSVDGVITNPAVAQTKKYYDRLDEILLRREDFDRHYSYKNEKFDNAKDAIKAFMEDPNKRPHGLGVMFHDKSDFGGYNIANIAENGQIYYNGISDAVPEVKFAKKAFDEVIAENGYSLKFDLDKPAVKQEAIVQVNEGFDDKPVLESKPVENKIDTPVVKEPVKEEFKPHFGVTTIVDGVPVKQKFEDERDALDHFMANKNSTLTWHDKYENAGFEMAGYNKGVTWYTEVDGVITNPVVKSAKRYYDRLDEILLRREDFDRHYSYKNEKFDNAKDAIKAFMEDPNKRPHGMGVMFHDKSDFGGYNIANINANGNIYYNGISDAVPEVKFAKKAFDEVIAENGYSLKFDLPENRPQPVKENTVTVNEGFDDIPPKVEVKVENKSVSVNEGFEDFKPAVEIQPVKEEFKPHYGVTSMVDGIPVKQKFDNARDALDHFMANKNSTLTWHDKYENAGFEMAGYNKGVTWYTEVDGVITNPVVKDMKIDYDRLNEALLRTEDFDRHYSYKDQKYDNPKDAIKAFMEDPDKKPHGMGVMFHDKNDFTGYEIANIASNGQIYNNQLNTMVPEVKFADKAFKEVIQENGYSLKFDLSKKPDLLNDGFDNSAIDKIQFDEFKKQQLAKKSKPTFTPQ
jgi:hypothetical protein